MKSYFNKACSAIFFMHLSMQAQVTIFTAKTIVTMNEAQPEAQAVAVRDGKILSVGTVETITSWIDDYIIDRRFEHQVIVPGFIEAHMHPQIAGFFWQYTYVGYFDRYGPDGTLVKGCKTKQQVLDRIRCTVEQKKDKEGWIIAWGYQSEFYEHEPLTVDELDALTPDYKIFVENMNMHILYVNSRVLDEVGFTPETEIEGLGKKDGKLTGELAEFKAMYPVLVHLPEITLDDMCKITRSASQLAHRVGVTTMVDAAYGIIFLTNSLKAYQTEVLKEDFPQRVVLFPIIALVKRQGGVNFLKKLHALNNDKLSFDAVKFLTDGSLHGLTAHLKWPYFLDCSNGIENISLEDLKRDLLMIHKAGFRAAIHVNGDQAIEQAVQAIKYVLDEQPRFEHRHSLEHNQMATENQLARMARLGIAANFMINHVHYWGDMYVERVIGYDRAERMNPLASAKRHGVIYSLHSDASVTPVDPLFTMWVATTRTTAEGHQLGPEQCISAYDALKAVTLDAAYLLGQDNSKGSIEVGKFADFTILDTNPLAVPVNDIKDIKVKATVLGGKLFPIADSKPSLHYLKLNELCQCVINGWAKR